MLDPATGAVLEIVKSGREDQDGGRAVSATALRRFGGLYREVMDAHDRWHHGRRGTPAAGPPTRPGSAAGAPASTPNSGPPRTG